MYKMPTHNKVTRLTTVKCWSKYRDGTKIVLLFKTALSAKKFSEWLEQDGYVFEKKKK